jgi:site-specific recombinase XerD
MEQTYFKEKDKEYEKKIRELLKELPKFCTSFFMGIETTKQARTRLAYAYDLHTYFTYIQQMVSSCRDIPMHEIPISIIEQQTADDIQEYLSWVRIYDKDDVEHTNSETGIKRKLSTLRSMYKYLYQHGKIESDPASLVETPKIHEKAIIRLDIDEISKLLDEVESGDNLTKKQQSFHNKTKVRDLAIMTLLLGTGIRVSECVGIDLDDLDFENDGVLIRRKGGNEAIIYFGEEVRNALLDYWEERAQIDAVQGHENAFFLSLQKKRMGVRSIEKLVKKYSQLVTTQKKITPHKLRSTYGTALYQETGDIYLVADVLGHKDVNTTRRHYAAIQENRRKSAADKVTLRETAEIQTQTKPKE